MNSKKDIHTQGYFCPTVPRSRGLGHGTKPNFLGQNAGTKNNPVDVSAMISAVFERDKVRDKGGTNLQKKWDKIGTKEGGFVPRLSQGFQKFDNSRLGEDLPPTVATSEPRIPGGFGSQYPADQDDWKEAERVFGDAFPPKIDPLAEHVSSDPAEPPKTMSVNQACQFLLDRFRETCPASAGRSKQGGVLRDVLEKYAFSDERKIDSLMLADWPLSGLMKPEEAIRRFVRRGWCGLCNIDNQEALRTLYRDSSAVAIEATVNGEFLGERAHFDGEPVDSLALAAHFTDEGMAAEIRAAHERFIAGQRAEHEATKGIKGLSVPIRYEGPSTAKTRPFMTADDFVLVVDKSIIWAADQFRVLLQPDWGAPALEAARFRNRRIMRNVEHVGNVIRIVSGSADPRRIPKKVRDLVTKLKGQGFKFDTDDAALLATCPGDETADEDLHAILPNAWMIKGLIVGAG